MFKIKVEAFMPDFDVNKFKDAVFNEKMFSVSVFGKKGVDEYQQPGASQPTSTRGRIWKNITNSVSSKENRMKASADVRETLVGNKDGKISNDNILKYLSHNIHTVTKKEELKVLKNTLAALVAFGADPEKCQEIEKVINGKLRLEELNRKLNEGNLEEFGVKKGENASKEVNVSKNKLEPSIAEKGMKVNLDKALYDHVNASAKYKDVYISKGELNSIQKTESTPSALKFSSSMETDIGAYRETNEDAEFVTDFSINGKVVGILAGVLDGHGGAEVSNFASRAFPIIFAEELGKVDGNVLVAFENTFTRLQAEIAKTDMPSGSTAVISYIDTKTNRLYTATLGDSEAFVCRNINGNWKLIPLSPIRNWRTDAERVKDIKGKGGQGVLIDSITKKPISVNDAKTVMSKKVRIVSEDRKRIANVSRSIGDIMYSHGGKGVVQKTKVSVVQLEPGDRLFLACDGITDYVEPGEMVEVMKEDAAPKELALKLIAKAKQKMVKKRGGDNASVIAFTIEANHPTT